MADDDRDPNEVTRLQPCDECDYRPWASEVEDNDGKCPECGWDPLPDDER